MPSGFLCCIGERQATKEQRARGRSGNGDFRLSGNKAEMGSRNALEAIVWFPLLGFYVWPALGHCIEEAGIKKGQ
jgi:hypothetical protein